VAGSANTKTNVYVHYRLRNVAGSAKTQKKTSGVFFLTPSLTLKKSLETWQVQGTLKKNYKCQKRGRFRTLVKKQKVPKTWQV